MRLFRSLFRLGVIINIPSLGAAAALAGTDLFPVTQGTDVPKKGTLAALATFVNAGAGALNVATINLTDAQIKTLPNYIEVLPAPGAGFAYALISAYLRLHVVAPYTNIGSDTYDSAIFFATGQDQSIYTPKTILLQGAGDWVCHLSAFQSFDAAFGVDSTSIGAMNLEDNQPLYIAAFNLTPGGDFTGGNAGNTLKVVLHYLVIAL